MKLKSKLIAVLALAAHPVIAEGNAPGAHFIENWDLDGDGVVTLAELEERRGLVFLTFDANEDGLLNAEEYAMFDEARANDMKNNAGHGNGMRRASEGMTLTFNDTDSDGAVSEAEFVAHAADWLALIDRDGSGDVTTADFGPRN